jgi:hypothetical protein
LTLKQNINAPDEAIARPGHRGFPWGSIDASLAGMRKNVVVDISAADRARLEAIIADRNSPQKHVWRAQIILLTAAGRGTVEITRRTGKSKNCIWRWQGRFTQESVAGLLHDKTPTPAHPAAWGGSRRTGGRADPDRPAR